MRVRHPRDLPYTYATLLNGIGKTLRPKVKCIINLQDMGAGPPDGGFFTQKQFQKIVDAALLPGQIPVLMMPTAL